MVSEIFVINGSGNDLLPDGLDDIFFLKLDNVFFPEIVEKDDRMIWIKVVFKADNINILIG